MLYKSTKTSIFMMLLISFTYSHLAAQTDRPNILLVIADDLGVDYTNGYHTGNLMPTTPTLDNLRANGITFENVFAAPVCSPTRAAIMSGKYGSNNGVLGVPGNLNLVHTSIFKELATRTNETYADAVIGKWHLSQPVDLQHPINHGVDYFMGTMGGGVADYFAWEKNENGVISIENEYATSVITDRSIDWIAQQDQPWFLWLAHMAPHSPFHVPPSDLFTINNTNGNRRKYVAMIEAVDTELNRLLQSMPDSVRNNTLVIFVGDNGTPNNILQDYPAGRGKSTLYQGGIRVPLIVAGAGVTRMNERESALIHVSDLYATILEAAGADPLPGGIHNSLSFNHLLRGAAGATRVYNFTEMQDAGNYGFAIRNQQYKYAQQPDGTEGFYDLSIDSFELVNLLDNPLTTAQQVIKADLELEAETRQNNWSCRDNIQNGDEVEIDCGGSLCNPCNTTSVDDFNTDQLKVYPNPGRDYFVIESASERINSIGVFNTMGQLIFEKNNINVLSTQVDIGKWGGQMLWLEIGIGEEIKTRRVMVE